MRTCRMRGAPTREASAEESVAAMMPTYTSGAQRVSEVRMRRLYRLPPSGASVRLVASAHASDASGGERRVRDGPQRVCTEGQDAPSGQRPAASMHRRVEAEMNQRRAR